MRTYKNKGQFLIIVLVAGFLIGIFYANFVERDNVLDLNIFEKSTLQNLKQTKIIRENYIIHVLRERITSLAVICIMGCMKWKRLYVGIVVSMFGFFSGILMVSAVLNMGIKGIMFCIAGMFPHMLFYGLAYGVLLWHWQQYPMTKWNKVKTVFVAVMFLAGIITEGFLNPWIMKGISEII